MNCFQPDILKKNLLLLFTVAALSLFTKTTAQQHQPLTIVYEITVKKNKNKAGIEETYNGGTKALFITGTKARIRLTTLMRIQSIFLEYDTAIKKATVIKESGKRKYLFHLTNDQWNQYNKKYDSVNCDTSFTDSANINGYPCRKAVIKTGDDDEITVFYTDSIKINNSLIEPAFRCIKGVVLQYETTTRKGIVQFTAKEISNTEIDKKIFIIPSKNVVVKKYNPNKKPLKETEEAEDSEE